MGVKVHRFKSYYAKGDQDYLVLALLEEDGKFYTVHKTMKEPYSNKSRVRELLSKGVFYTDSLVRLFHWSAHQDLADAQWAYNQSLG